MVKPDISDGVTEHEPNAASVPSCWHENRSNEGYYPSLISHFTQPIGLNNENYYNTHNAGLLNVLDTIPSQW